MGVQVADVANLGSYQLTLAYEPALLRVDAVTLGNFLASTGRTVTPQTPLIDNTTGQTTWGAYTTGATPAGPGGAGTLAWIRLRGLAQGTGHLHLKEAQAADVTGKGIPLGLNDGAILIVPCEGDFDGDGEVDAEDVQRVAYRWNAVYGQSTYDPFYDLDSNCQIDIADVQRVAGRWGVRCAGPTGSSATDPGAAGATVFTIQPAGQVVGVGQMFTCTGHSGRCDGPGRHGVHARIRCGAARVDGGKSGESASKHGTVRGGCGTHQ